MYKGHKTEKEKELLKIYREYCDKYNWSNRRDSGEVVELEEPYQQGWDRYYVLREQTKNRRDAHNIARVLDLINVTATCHRGDFLTRDYQSHKWVPIQQPLRTLSVAQYEKLNEKEKSFFTSYWEYYDKIFPSARSEKKKAEQRYYFANTHFFEFKVVPRMITHRWIPDQAFETRRAELEHYINMNNLWPKINKALGCETSAWRKRYERYNFSLEKDIPIEQQFDLDEAA